MLGANQLTLGAALMGEHTYTRTQARMISHPNLLPIPISMRVRNRNSPEVGRAQTPYRGTGMQRD